MVDVWGMLLESSYSHPVGGVIFILAEAIIRRLAAVG